MFELAQHRAHKRVALVIGIRLLRQLSCHHLKVLLIVRIVNNLGPFHAFHQYANRAVWQLQHLADIGDCSDPKNIILSRLFNIDFRLRTEEDQIIFYHRLFQRFYRLLASDIQMEDHTGVDKKTSERQQGEAATFCLFGYHRLLTSNRSL
ncbi:hypothetical protein D3C71_1167100 [compost metagenome]